MASKRTFRQQLEDLATNDLRGLRCFIRRRTDSWEEAEDVIQDAFVSAWKNIDKFRGESELSSWFCRIAINCWLMRKRKGKNHQRVDNDTEQTVLCFLADPRDVEAESINHIDYQKLTRVISQLPTCYNRSLLMRGQGLMYKEIAVEMGVSTGTIKCYVNRGKVKLQRALEKRRGAEVYQPQ